MKKDLPKASYRIEDVIIIESHFKREMQIDFEKGTIHNQVDLKNTSQEDSESSDFNVIMEASIQGKQDDNVVFNAKVIIVGIFEKISEGELDIATFKNINGPAMLFPFLREHIATSCVKAGMKKILLPPINFTKHNPHEDNVEE